MRSGILIKSFYKRRCTSSFTATKVVPTAAFINETLGQQSSTSFIAIATDELTLPLAIALMVLKPCFQYVYSSAKENQNSRLL
jgi:hypothetical protein